METFRAAFQRKIVPWALSSSRMVSPCLCWEVLRCPGSRGGWKTVLEHRFWARGCVRAKRERLEPVRHWGVQKFKMKTGTV